MSAPIRLTDRHAPALEELLVRDPWLNLFLIGYLDHVPIGRTHWYGLTEGESVRAVVVVVSGRLTVPYAPDPADATVLGRFLHGRHRPTMMVGPRDACDAMWAEWAPRTTVDRWYDQRLYVSDQPQPGAPLPGFRRANLGDLEEAAVNAAAMEREDLGRMLAEEDPAAFLGSVRRRIERGNTWVLERDGRLVFQINVGTRTVWGIQVGGTYVPPDHRGQGLATLGMQELSRRLLPRDKAITLHVNEANTPAVRVYERSGYRPYAPFRLLTLPPAR